MSRPPSRRLPATDWTNTPDGLWPQTLERPGTRLHYWDGGPDGSDGPTPVTFLHGATMDHRMFNAQVQVVLDGRRVLVWDARGHGRSRPIGIDRAGIEDHVDDLVAMLDDAGVRQTILVGQSMGGYVAQHAIRLHPDRFRALVVIGCTPIAFPLSAFDAAALRLTARSFASWPRRHLRTMIASATALREDVRAYALEAVGSLDRADISRIFATVATAVSRTGFTDLRIDVSTLLTHGDRDRTGNIRRDGPRWAASDPRIEYAVVPDAGHNANQDNAEWFNRRLLTFLDAVDD